MGGREHVRVREGNTPKPIRQHLKYCSSFFTPEHKPHSDNTDNTDNADNTDNTDNIDNTDNTDNTELSP